tara:strand:+ start:393 stop:1526 length:1134 start_codon:yes stop_codon:yes gene_type:complete
MSTTKQEQEALPLKVKKPSLKRNNDQVYKLDLTKKSEDAVQEQSAETIHVRNESEDGRKVGEAHEEKQDTAIESKEEIKSPITEVKENNTAEVKEVEHKPKIEVPENIEKLISFMKDTGGNVEDYVRLNADYTKIDNDTLLMEYYSKTKPHLEKEEIEFLIEDNFSYDEEIDEEKEVKKKRLAAKEEIAKARNFLEETKSKYYDEIKLRPGVTQEQQKAMDFFNRYNKEQEIASKNHESFQRKTNEMFASEFEGFEFNLGEKKFKYGVSNIGEVAEKQSNLNTFVKKFLNKEGEVVDTVGYHKAIYAAENADTIANHFYEQGKADAVKDVIANSKNINKDPRPQANGDVFINGFKVKAISGADSSKLKFKIKNKNNN